MFLISLIHVVEVFAEDHVVVVLRNVVLEAVVFGQERDQLGRGPVVPQFLWDRVLCLQHVFEYLLALAASLHAFMHVEVEDAKRVYFLDGAGLVANEKVLLAHFEEGDRAVALHAHVQTGVRTLHASIRRDHGWQLLGLRRRLAHLVNYLRNLVALREPAGEAGGRQAFAAVVQ